MRVEKRNPDLAYVSADLWLPKNQMNVDAVKSALILQVSKGKGVETVVKMWKETDHHLIVPREMYDLAEITGQFRTVDVRPQTYTRTYVKSRIVLDAKSPEFTTQKDSVAAMMRSHGGVLQLGCVAGDTEIRLNRAGIGFRISVADAYRRLHKTTVTMGPKWRNDIPTRIRAKTGDRVGLHTVIDIVMTGVRQVHELRLKDGKKLKLTGDHKVLTPYGDKSIDDGLTAGDLVYVDSGQGRGERRGRGGRKSRDSYKRLSWYASHPFVHKSSVRKGEQRWCLEEHRAVVEANLNGLSLGEFRGRCKSGNTSGLSFVDPAKFHVHHVDGDKRNNSLHNLRIMSVVEHRLEHNDAGHFNYGRLLEVEVESVALNVSEEEVYDVVCDDPHHNFVANGIVVHNCGLGKSVVALEVIARLQVPALIVVDTTQLIKQWGGEIRLFLDVPGGVGLLQGKVHDWKKAVCITTYQTLSALADDLPEGMGSWYGVVIFDEGHHLGAEMFSRSANIVSGRRYGLTATPERVDGTTRLYFSHLGKILHKDLRTDLEPTVVFYKTGVSLELGDDVVRSAVCDVNGEVHHGKLSSYLGRHKGRTEIVLAEIRKARAEGRRCLILSYSIEELVNLFAAWSGVPGSYSEVAPPTLAEAGVTVPPEKLTATKLNNQIKSRNVYKGKLARATGADREPLLFALKQVEYALAKHEAALTMERAWDKKKDAYIQRVVAGATDAGLMIGDVHVDKRTKFLEEKKVVFAIMKYGREALNQPLLDTIIACESVGQEGALRQLLGRALRKREGKRSAVAVFFEDEIGLCIGMCRKLRRFLADNPQDAGGPIKFHIVNHDVKDNFWKRLA